MPFATPPRPELARRVMDVEDLLAWAYIDELPKDRGLGGAGPAEPCEVSPMFRHADLGTRVDARGWEPRLPAALGAPDPDALAVEVAVARLRDAVMPAAGDALQLLPDLAAFGVDEAAAVARAAAMAPGIVVRCAKLRRRPYWTKATAPGAMWQGNGRAAVVRWEPIFTLDLNGEEVEHEALVPVGTLRGGDYPFGAYCPLRYEPDPRTIADERAEYLVWWRSLVAIAAELSGRLQGIAVLPPGAAERPWTDDVELSAPPRVFADLTARAYRREERETAAAHRALGARRMVGRRGAAERYFGAPRRAVAGRETATRRG